MRTEAEYLGNLMYQRAKEHKQIWWKRRDLRKHMREAAINRAVNELNYNGFIEVDNRKIRLNESGMEYFRKQTEFTAKDIDDHIPEDIIKEITGV